MRRRRPVAGLAAVLLGAPLMALTQAAAWTSPAAADPVADCSTTVGTIVAVDFAPQSPPSTGWPGDVERGCAVQLTTEYAAMHTAGFKTSGDGTDGDAFVCRIDDEPSDSEQSCLTTPPASAYWSFWYADAGQTGWTYSEQGAMDFEPQPGSVTAWVFGSTGSRPPKPPSALRATNTSPTTTTTMPITRAPTTTSTTVTSTSVVGATATSAPPTTSTTAVTGSTTVATSVPRASSTTSPPAGSTAPTTTTAGAGGSGPAAVGTVPSAGPKIVDVGSAGSRIAGSQGAGSQGAGSPLPLVVGGLLAVCLASAALLVARRRRRA